MSMLIAASFPPVEIMSKKSHKPMLPTHPVDEATAAFYHGVLAGLALLGVWFHTLSAIRHWRDS